ncbi:MAG: DUF805 domain-containing protein [Pseudomonadota bacterium]
MSPQAPTAIDLAEPMSPLHIFVGLRGRIPRKIFWLYGVAVPLGLGAYLHALLAIAGVGGQALEGMLNLALLWSALAVSVKRWHDRDKSGWWALVQFIPVVGWLWTLVENGLLRGTVGPNRFGQDLTGRL